MCSPTSTPPDLKKGSTGVKSNSLRENGSSLRKMAKVRFGWPTHWYLGVMQWKLKYQSLQSISKTVTPCGSSFNGLRPSRRDWRKKRPGLFLIFHEVYIYIPSKQRFWMFYGTHHQLASPPRSWRSCRVNFRFPDGTSFLYIS